jgi:MYXO-CTERM domain-containing protein
VEWAGDDGEGRTVADGAYPLELVVRDGAGHTAQAAAQVEVDTVPPQPPTFTLPAEGDTVPPDTSFRGLAEAGVQVTVLEGDAELCSGRASDLGSWACLPAAPLPEGEHTVTAVAEDRAGARSEPSAPLHFTVRHEEPGSDAGVDAGDADGGVDGGSPEVDGGPQPGADAGDEETDAGDPDTGTPPAPDLGTPGSDDAGQQPGKDAGPDGKADGSDDGDGCGGCDCSTAHAAGGPGSLAWPLIVGVMLVVLRRRR